MRNLKLDKYLKRKSMIREVYFNKYLDLKKFKIGVVIPVYGEYEFIGDTLASLSNNESKVLDETLVLLVINSPELNSNSIYVEENKNLLYELQNKSFIEKFDLGKLNLAWIDAASNEDKVLPGKGGVGVARKLGMDSILNFLDWNYAPVIISLDADTIVEPNYLSVINIFFEENSEIVAATVNFKHLAGASKEEEKAIREYELFIHDYVNKLRYAGSPYAFFTIGSAMVCRGDAYIRVGGMKQNRGGEDFYFLQDLRKLGEVGNITDTTVYQSARPSDRVPFGTGPKIQQCIDGHNVLFYNHKIFQVLKKVIHGLESWIRTGEIDNPQQFIEGLSPEAKEYFRLLNFNSIWSKILENNLKRNKEIVASDYKKLIWAFHVWFDAFKTLKFIHFLERNYPEKYHKERNIEWNR